MLMRHGQELNLTMRERPGAGLCVLRETGGIKDYVPIETFIQRDLLELPRLALQIQRALDRSAQKRAARYIDGPAILEAESCRRELEGASDELKLLLCENEPGVTNLVQLMAPAGHGKTVLLEEVSHASTREYRPDAYPYPLVLLVDLLGRFVGNIDDAIAGAINNTYSFPSLTQKDVVVAMRHRWLTLALDGFDELVARIGPKDAFLRISDLLDQIDGAGSLIISARESFFELHRIGIAIRSYLQPKRGSFQTTILRLCPWTERQGVEVFRALKSERPSEDLEELRTAFADDAIAFQPFFLTRLADLWRKGERFSSDKPESKLGRVKFVVERLLEREVVEKWRDSKGNAILSKEAHELVLCTIAEDMFRTGAFFLRADEVRLAAQIALGELKTPSANITDAVERVPTHAFLQNTERGYRFAHDKFLHYFLGTRLGYLCVARTDEFIKCLSDKEITPEITEWAVSHLACLEVAQIEVAKQIIEKTPVEPSDGLRANLGILLPQILDGAKCEGVIVFRGIIFSGDTLSGTNLSGVVFSECSFVNIDLADTSLSACEFFRCKFDTVAISETTVLAGSHLEGCDVGALHLSNREKTFYSPQEITERIVLLGATVGSTEELIQERVLADDIPADAIDVVERLVRASNKGWDVCIEEFSEKWGPLGAAAIDIALRYKILRTWNRDTGGPRRHFVRFQIDRNRLLQSLREPSVESQIEGFWRDLAQVAS